MAGKWKIVAVAALLLVSGIGMVIWQGGFSGGLQLIAIEPGGEINTTFSLGSQPGGLTPQAAVVRRDGDLITRSYQIAFGRYPTTAEANYWQGVINKDARWRNLDTLVQNHRTWLQGAKDEISQTAMRAIKAALGGQTVPSYYYDTLTKAPVPIYTEMFARTVIMEAWLQTYNKYPTDADISTYVTNGPDWAPAKSVEAMKKYLADQAKPAQPPTPAPTQPAAAPLAPINLDLRHAIDDIWWVSWEQQGSTEAGFRLYRRSTQDRDFQLLAEKPARGPYDGFQVTDTTALQSKTWIYKVCAYNNAGETCSAEASTSASILPPRNLRATAATTTTLTLQFTQAGNGVKQFNVMAKSGSTWATVGQVTATGGDGSTYTYTVTGLKPNTLGTYKVCAVGDGNPCGDEVMSATNPDYAAAPTGLKVTAINATRMRLDWTPNPGSNAVAVQLFDDGTNKWKTLATLSASDRYFVDDTKSYTMPGFKYRVCDGSGYTCSDPVVIGRQFDHPYNFYHLDTGIYWFRCGTCRNSARLQDNGFNSDGVKAVPGLSKEYFDPSKPTVIYVHGWEKDTVRDMFRESMKGPISEAAATPETGDMMAKWKAGWNVGIFYWNQFSDDDWKIGIPTNAEAKIWGDAAGGMTYGINDGNSGWKQGTESVSKTSAAELFLDAYLEAMQGYDGTQKEIRIVGHSLGNQMAVRMVKLLAEKGNHPELMPKRVALIDPYYSNDDRKNAVANFVTSLKQNQKIVFEMYQTSALSSPGKVADLTVYTRVHPDYVWKTDQAKAHVAAVHWYFMSMAVSPWAYAPGWFGIGVDYSKHVGTTPSAAMDTQTLRSLQTKGVWWEQDGGKDTWLLDDDKFVQKKK